VENGIYGEWLPLTEASARLGITLDTIRKKVQKGDFQARKTPSQKGLRWEVYLVSDQPQDQSSIPLEEVEPSQATSETSQLILLLRDLTDRLDRVSNEKVQLAGQVGFLQAQLQQAQAEILLLKSPPPPAPEPQDEKNYPWWLFWKYF